ncbi:hypothetical protein PHMEG_0007433 [Phytophthora megakarya]|uniref:Anoctamin transmembrane domain-containing protein n=1 Tax=Phytophthora megakarya TaxID=4795 RepID=A0A225WLN3_9STRA|nr:hypothetical protein PHMEG_0007433 [Phytophthora megakarya]
MTTRVIEVNIIAESEVPEIRQVYIKASEQTCSLIKHWISHICVGMSSSGNRANFNLSCQHEFIALLLKSFNFANSYLSWSIGIKLSLLIQLFLPALRQAAVNVVSFICCLSGDDLAIKTMEGMFQQSYPPIAYEEAVELYLKSLKVRDQGRIDAEREAFEKVWSARTGRRLSDIRTPRVIITASDFSAVVRTLMLHRLTAVCKLDVSLSVSDDGQLLLVRIFASDNLLLATLCETETYRLQFADAIDPGTLFWRDRKEVRTDQKVFDENTVKHRLKLLLAENVISPKEAIRFPGESVDRVSARINALSRISRSLRGLIRCCNPAPAFASYSPNIQRQFLYKKYHNKLDMPETYRRSAVLRTVDCIRITKRIINAEFDTKATLANHLVSYFHCLHSSSRFDINSRGALASSWATFWRRSHLPGEFYPDDHAILNFIGRIDPFRQPLQEVRDYFGEFIGLYCAWIGFYAKMMILPAFIAMVVLASEVQHSPVTALWYFYTSPEIPDDADKIVVAISLPELGLGLGMIVWSFVLIKLWERRSIWYQLQWGIDSWMVSFQRQLGSWLCVLALGGANMVVVLMVLLGQGVLVDILGERLAIMVSCLCQAILVQCNSACIFNVARALTKWENPHYSTDHVSYRNSVVAKMFLLHLVNTFTVLILLMMSSVGGLAILERILPPLRSLYSSYNSCIEDRVDIFIRLGTQLIALFTVQLCIRIILVLSTIKRKEYEDETMLSPYPGPYKDYAQLSMQFGLVVMFSSVCPILPLIALVDCAVKLRQNALELCCIRQRPEPEGVKTQGHDENDIGLGPWESCIFLMVRLSVPVVLALTIFTVNSFDDISVERRIGYWLIGVLGISIMTQLLWFLIPRKSRTAEEARARNDFLVERYFGHAEVQRQKTLPSGKHVDKENVNIQEPAPSVEQSLHHYEERLELLQRLNVALRKRDDIGGSVYVTTTKIDVPTPPNQYADQETEDEPPLRKSEIGEEMVIGYFRPVRNIWPPTPQRQEIVKESDPPADMVGFTEDSPRPVEELKIDESGDDTIRSSVESENDVGSTGTPAPRVFSKLFKQKSASLDPSSVSDEVVPQADFEPGVFAPTDVVVAEIIHESSNDAELLEEKSSTPSSAIGPGAPLRQSRTSFFSRKPKHSDLILGDNVERKNDTLAVPDPPPPRRLSTFYRRAQPSSSTGTSIVAPREPVASNVSGFEKAEIDERSVNPVQSLHDQFDFLSDTRS